MLRVNRVNLKWIAFSLLNQVIDRKSSLPVKPTIYPPEHQSGDSNNFIWVFCSTIGEVNACLPFLRSIEKLGNIVLITDHDCYRGSYHLHFPNAYVVELTGRASDGRFLAKQLPPCNFIVCEIPAMPSDAPCRLSYSLLREARRAGAKIHLVNAWLYSYLPACRMDALERRLFQKDYLNSFETIGTQNEEIKYLLIQAGAKQERVYVAGNMKFDAVRDIDVMPSDDNSEALLASLSESQSPVVVAGCLADLNECYEIFDALAKVRNTRPDIRFIIAPRHPENAQFMGALTDRLDQSGLPYRLKTELNGSTLDENNILILNTFGELKSFYSIANLCYVGCNHNVLEPLSLGKFTIVSGEWNRQYPSYPVYQLTREKGLVKHVDGVQEISDIILSHISTDRSDREEKHDILSQLHSLSGAVQKTLDATQLTQYS